MRPRMLLLPFFMFVFISLQGQAQTPSAGDIVISEIMYAPDGPDTDREYVEVYNTTDQAIDLEGWFLVEEDPSGASPDKDDINTSVTVPPNDFVVLCENDVMAENGGVSCAYDYANDVSHTNVADYVVLQRSDGTEIDRVPYDEENGWPDAMGRSIEYVGNMNDDNAQPQYWEAATARAGDYANTSGSNQGSPNVNAPDGALPVELARFRVEVEARRAALAWATASETGNAGFAVQHRPPGADGWTTQGFVEGSGTTRRPQDYSFRTEVLAPGTHAFRLRQDDVDGTAHYSAVKRVEVRPGGLEVTLNGPNPLRPGDQVVLRATARRPVKAALFNVLGQRVRTLTDGPRGPQHHVRARLTPGRLSSGTYVLRVRSASQQVTRMLTVIR